MRVKLSLAIFAGSVFYLLQERNSFPHKRINS